MLPLSLLLVVLIALVAGKKEKDNHKDCQFWASIGECTKNPSYMLTNCAPSCAAINSKNGGNTAQVSIYDIVEKDINGKDVNFDKFRGKVLYIVNVASHCGYTAENYKTFRNLAKHRSEFFEIIVAPCNQFGFQEPGDNIAIKDFASKQSFKGIILSKGDVNGPKTRPLFEFLKGETNRDSISWNFDGKFLVDKEGKVRILEQDDVEAEILTLIGDTEL